MGKQRVYCTGKIMKVNTGNIDGENQNCYTRTKEEGCYSYSDSRRNTEVRFESQSFRDKSKRVDRAYGTQPCFSDTRTANAGGNVLQLIEETQKQIALRQSELQHLEGYIQKLKLFLEQLEKIEE